MIGGIPHNGKGPATVVRLPEICEHYRKRCLGFTSSYVRYASLIEHGFVCSPCRQWWHKKFGSWVEKTIRVWTKTDSDR